MTLQEKEAAFEAAIKRYRDVRDEMNTAAVELIKAVTKEYVPGAVKAVLDDSDQEGSDYTFSHFEDAEGNTIHPAEKDEDLVQDLIVGPATSIYPEGILGYEIEVT